MLKKSRYLIFILAAVMALILIPVSRAEAATYVLPKPVIESALNTAGGIEVVWGAVDGAEAYTILRKTGENGSWVKKATVTNSRWTDTSAVSGKTYYYAVRCSTADGSKYTSLRDTAGTPVFCIRSRNIYLSVKPTGLRLSWSAITNVTEYDVYKRVKGTQNWELLTSTKSTYVLDDNVTSGVTYEYTVAGKKKINGEYTYGPIDANKVKSKKFIAAPTIQMIRQNGTSIHISWDAVDGAAAYTILRKVNDGSWVKKATTTDTYWIDTAGKTSGNIYTYAVRCSNTAGTSYTSARYDGTSFTYLKTPVIKEAENMADGIRLKISLVKCTQSLEVHRIDSDGTDTTTDIIDNNNSNTVYYTDTDVISGENYIYYIVGIYNDARVISEAANVMRENTVEKKYVAGSFINLYIEQDAEAEFIVLPYMTEITYLETTYSGTLGSWLKIEYNGNIYYMWQDNEADEKLTDKKSEFSYSSENQYVDEALRAAMEIYAQPTTYRRNDSTGVPDANGNYGYDCSGFVSYVIKNTLRPYIPTLDYYAKVDQMYEMNALYNEGLEGEFSIQDIPLDYIQPGDIIFFNLADESGDEVEDGMPNHVGMYLGNNEFIHCTHYNWGGDGVFIMPLDENYTSSIVAIRRFIPSEITPANRIQYLSGFKVNFRNAPSADAEVVATGYGNESVSVMFAGDIWAYVLYNDTAYFIDRTYLADMPGNLRYTEKAVGLVKITLYSEPTSDCETKETIYAGENVLCAGRYFDSNFYIVRYNDTDWYYYTESDIDDVFVDDMSQLITNASAARVSQGVYMRETPETSGTIIRMLSKNETVYIICGPNVNSNWVYVMTENGEYGFTSASRLVQAE